MSIQGIPATENPSPAPSSESESSHHSLHSPAPSISRPRPGRTPAKVQLRTAFRTFSAMAAVVVGDENYASRPAVTYVIHKELLTSASPFFAAALNSTFAEGLDQTVRLPEEKPEIFEWFLQWLYTGTLAVPGPAYQVPGGPPALSPEDSYRSIQTPRLRDQLVQAQKLMQAAALMDGDLRNHAGSPKYFLLIDLYGLSDRILTTPLSNHILSTIARLSEATNSVPTPSDTRILYEQIRSSSPLRSLILDLFAYKKTDKLLETHKDEWHAKFLRELVVKLKRPGPEGVGRHLLRVWRPADYGCTKACEGCRQVLKPGISHDLCVGCERAFCAACVRQSSEGRVVLGEDVGGCKPWTGKGLCLRYHEHEDGEECDIHSLHVGSVFGPFRRG